MWEQNYDPFDNAVLSTIAAAAPIVTLLILIASRRVKPYIAALIALGVANIVAIAIFAMPAPMSIGASLFGIAAGILPIGWILLNILFFHRLMVVTGRFELLRHAIFAVTADRRLQVLLIAFAFGALLEGLTGSGAAVAIVAAILAGLGFSPLAASVVALVANVAAVAFSTLGAPIQAVASTMMLDPATVGAMVGRQVPLLSMLLPFWLIGVFAGWRGMLGVWPAVLLAGSVFATFQFAISNFVSPWLVDVAAALATISCLIALILAWQPKHVWIPATLHGGDELGSAIPLAPIGATRLSAPQWWSAMLPWIILCVVMLIGRSSGFQSWADAFNWRLPFPGIHDTIGRLPPSVSCVQDLFTQGCRAVPLNISFGLNPLSFTGTGFLIAAILTGLAMGMSPAKMLAEYGRVLKQSARALVAISTVVAVATLGWLSGTNTTLGMAFANTGFLYPFFGTLLGWAGVIVSGSNLGSNGLFGHLQEITSQQLGLSPVLMGSAGASGGALGEMADLQSILFASTAANAHERAASVLRYVFLHSFALACMMGALVMLQAYVYPFTLMVAK